ncbi:MAG TPA: hypothetical protein VGJ98_07175 [Candidatus Eisenbacteria bacterium]
MDRRYIASLLFRLSLITLAVLFSVRALYVVDGGVRVWCLAGLFGLSAAVLQRRPLVVPTPGRGSTVYNPASAFFLAALFLIPAGPLVLAIAFAVGLAGLVTGTRPHKILLQLSIAILTFGGCSYWLKLGPRGDDPNVPPPELIATEILLGAVVLITGLVLRSIAIRLERGEEAPHWGAFQRPALIEALLCLALAVSISVLGRIHLALMSVVYVYLGFTCWLMERYRRHLRDLDHEPTEASEDQGRWVA